MWWRDTSPGVKILWLWTFGTAAVLVTNVGRTRMRDMEQLTNAPDQTTPQTAGNGSSDAARVIAHEEKS